MGAIVRREAGPGPAEDGASPALHPLLCVALPPLHRFTAASPPHSRTASEHRLPHHVVEPAFVLREKNRAKPERPNHHVACLCRATARLPSSVCQPSIRALRLQVPLPSTACVLHRLTAEPCAFGLCPVCHASMATSLAVAHACVPGRPKPCLLGMSS
jgi:hypothetical protein